MLRIDPKRDDRTLMVNVLGRDNDYPFGLIMFHADFLFVPAGVDDFDESGPVLIVVFQNNATGLFRDCDHAGRYFRVKSDKVRSWKDGSKNPGKKHEIRQISEGKCEIIHCMSEFEKEGMK